MVLIKMTSFTDDKEKMTDFVLLDKEEFLNFYSYLTEQDYDDTKRDLVNKAKNIMVRKV